MASDTLREILKRAIADAKYRELLFGDPDKALEGYSLSEQESAILKQLTHDQQVANVIELEKRISTSGLIQI